MQWIYNDGGRAAAGFKGRASDCVCRTIAIVTGQPYIEIYNYINEHCANRYYSRDGYFGGQTGVHKYFSASLGIHKTDTRAIMAAFGLEWIPTMRIGQGCKVHLRAEELPMGRIAVKLSHHVTAVIDSIIHDTFDPHRDGMRCVYGYWVLRGGSL